MYSTLQIIEKRKELWQQHKNITQDKAYTDAAAAETIKSKELQEQIQNNPEHLIEMFFYIVDKDKNTVPFFLNIVQQSFIDRLNSAKEEYKQGTRFNLKFLVLKGRQQGFTTLITAYQLACTISRANFEGFTAADEDANTNAIFENKAKFPYSRLPELVRPTEKYNNRKQLLFEKLNSSWEVKTASKNMGRSRTINFMHGSEAAFWKDGISGVQAGLGEALTKDAVQILESTANGYNEYKDLWDSDKWENCFYEWWLTPEYSHNFANDDIKIAFINKINKGKDWIHDRCRWLQREICLEWEQIYWYYNKYQGYIDQELIKQEYPCTPEEAFLSSGACIFDKEKIIQRKRYLERQYTIKPPQLGEFIITWNDPDRMDYPVGYKWTESVKGCIKLFEDPDLYHPYVLGGDTKGEGSDKFAGTIINNATGYRSATLHGEMGSKYYTSQMWALANHYNEALIGIETNFNTYPIELLQEWHYNRQYMREKKDTITGELKKQHGFRTDVNTRPLIIEKEITVVNEDIGNITDIETLKEMLTFVKDKNGRPDAEAGKHDDLLFSDMIANEIRGQQSFLVDIPINNSNDDDDEDDRSSGGWYD